MNRRRSATPEPPNWLQRLWGQQKEPATGRPAKLTLPTIVNAAIRLADTRGIAAVTIPAVARAAGYTTMSLYRHLDSKEELLELLQDAGFGDPPRAPKLVGWRNSLITWTADNRLVYHRRPWLLEIPISRPPSGPHQLAWFDSGLAALCDTRLRWDAKVGIVSTLSGYARHSAQLAQGLAAGRGIGVDQTAAEHDYGTAMRVFVTKDRFPQAAELFSSPLFTRSPRQPADPTKSPDFTFGLNLILDGVAMLADRRQRHP